MSTLSSNPSSICFPLNFSYGRVESPLKQHLLRMKTNLNEIVLSEPAAALGRARKL